LSYLTFHIAETVPGLEVTRDGVLVGRAQFDVSLPVDPGRHSISLRAPGYESVELAVVVGEKHDRQTVNLPKLKEKPLLPASPPLNPAPIAARNTVMKSNPWPWVLGGVGTASLLVGTVSGILAVGENHRMSQACPDRLNCTNDVVVAQGRRDLEAKIAWVGIPIGIAVLGGAATWLLLSHPSNDRNNIEHTALAIGTYTNGRDFSLCAGGTY
jgi:hypothetical protein